MTVESMFSMNRATATISGTMRFASISQRSDLGALAQGRRQRKRRARAVIAAAESSNAVRRSVMPHVSRIGAAPDKPGIVPRRARHHIAAASGSGVMASDLPARSPHSTACPPAERPAVLGHLQPHPDCALPLARVHLPRLFSGSVAARRHRGSYEARGSQAPRTGGRDRAARAAAGLAPLIRARTKADVTGRSRQSPLLSVNFRQIARIRARAVLSTGANPKRAVESRARPLFRNAMIII